jgi:hypothetical protein
VLVGAKRFKKVESLKNPGRGSTTSPPMLDKEEEEEEEEEDKEDVSDNEDPDPAFGLEITEAPDPPPDIRTKNAANRYSNGDARSAPEREAFTKTHT